MKRLLVLALLLALMPAFAVATGVQVSSSQTDDSTLARAYRFTDLGPLKISERADLQLLPRGLDGSLEIVLASSLSTDADSIFVVVRNNTSQSVDGLTLTATVRDGDRRVAVGETSEFIPSYLGPGVLAIAVVSLSGEDASGLSVVFDLEAGPPDYEARDLTLFESSVADESIDGTLRNSGVDAVADSYVVAGCFTDFLQVTWWDKEGLDAGRLDPFADGEFSIGSFESCDNFLLAAGGTADS